MCFEFRIFSFIWLSPNKGWIGFEIAAQVADKELGLNVGYEADVAFFAEIGMGDLFLFSLLPGSEQGFPGGVGKGHFIFASFSSSASLMRGLSFG